MSQSVITCECPNDILYRFEGTLQLGGSLNDVIVPLSTDQILLRGSSLRNTEYAYGVVVFTGHETKIMMNSVGSRAKFSKLEIATNTYIILIVSIQFTISLVGAIFNSVWQTVFFDELNKYLDLGNGGYPPLLNFLV
jgi:magnesium-transporting ATPase (P-type)